VRFSLRGAKPVSQATIQRIDSEHANAKPHWEQMGKPEYLSAAMVSELGAVSRLRKDAQPITFDGGISHLELTMPPLSVAAIEFAY
jgi:xylan 1,4-beta-xylosidase